MCCVTEIIKRLSNAFNAMAVLHVVLWSANFACRAAVSNQQGNAEQASPESGLQNQGCIRTPNAAVPGCLQLPEQHEWNMSALNQCKLSCIPQYAVQQSSTCVKYVSRCFHTAGGSVMPCQPRLFWLTLCAADCMLHVYPGFERSFEAISRQCLVASVD
jgi:hypothetical protein